MNERILVVDDDVELCKLLKQCLGNEGFEVAYLHNGNDAITYLKNNGMDLMILDIMLPGIDGFEVLRQIRAFSEIPVIMLSAKGEEMNKVIGLRTGADDYITKPFGLSELIARVETLFRRCKRSKQMEEECEILTFGDLQIDKTKCNVFLENREIQLTSKEYKLLCFFAENPQKVFTKKQIYSNVWEEKFMYDDNTIMALISRLRKKIEKDSMTQNYIQTVWGIGYRFNGAGK